MNLLGLTQGKKINDSLIPQNQYQIMTVAAQLMKESATAKQFKNLFPWQIKLRDGLHVKFKNS
jgi:hypothetical protein